MCTVSLLPNEATNVSITIASATVARVPEEIRVDESLLTTYLQQATDIGVMSGPPVSTSVGSESIASLRTA